MRAATIGWIAMGAIALSSITSVACSDDPTASLDATIVEGEPALGVALDLIRVTLVRLEGTASGRVREIDAEYDDGRLRPVTVRFEPESASDPGRTLYRVRAEGVVGDRVVVQVQHRVTFVPGRTITVALRLEASCRDVTCDGDLTCQNGMCVDDLIPCDQLFDGGCVDAGTTLDAATDDDAHPGDDGDVRVDAADDAGCNVTSGVETECTDALDDDCDGATDCADSDCATVDACAGCAGIECPECERCVAGECVADPGATCAGGTCTARGCCTGCLRSTGTCVGVTATTDAMCGSAGAMCVACNECETCSGGACVPREGAAIACGGGTGTCHAGACCTGCWDAASATCESGTTRGGCGIAGADCATCECEGECRGGACVIATRMSAIAAGDGNTCALGADHELWCWGTMDGGALPPVHLITAGFTGLSNGVRPDDGSANHRCAIGASGLACWGENDNGELGFGDYEDRASPEIADGSAWSVVSVGGRNSCAIRSSSAGLHCWGYNGEGRVGNGETGGTVPSPEPIGGGTRWLTVAVGEAHAFAITEDYGLFAWGNDSYSRLGNGIGMSHRDHPSEIGASMRWVAVSAGTRHACAIERTMQQLYCWGWNEHFELGLGPIADPRDVPTRVSTVPVSAVSAGDGFTCAIDEISQLYCWGHNIDGRLGLGDTVARNVPAQVGTDAGWIRVSAGQDHTCALRLDGRVYCFGDNARDQLGQPHETLPIAMRPVRVCF